MKYLFAKSFLVRFGTVALTVFISLTAFLSLPSCRHTVEPHDHSSVDTTSHDLVVDIVTLGDYGCNGNDVAILGPNDVWLGGRMYVDDGHGGSTYYNSAHWDGAQWSLDTIKIPICYGGGDQSAPFEILAMLAVSPNEIWFTSGGGFVHQVSLVRENVCHPDSLLPSAIDRLVKGVNNDFWGVGYSGSVVHYSAGGVWESRSFPSQIRLLDLVLSPDGKRLWTCGFTSSGSESGLFMLDSAGWHTIAHNPPYEGSEEDFTGVWTDNNDSLWVVGNVGVYRFSQKPPYGFRKEPVTITAFPWSIRGRSGNDIFVCGEKGMLLHYNGASWWTYTLPGAPGDLLRSIAVSDHDVFVVGVRYIDGLSDKTVIYHGRR